MSDSPDDLQINEPATAQSSGDASSETAPAPADPMQEMRVIIIALFVAILVVSISFNAFVLKQNSRVQLELENANNQLAQIEQNPVVQQNRAAMQNLLSELMAQIPAHPEAQQILARYNINPPTGPQPAPPTQPQPTVPAPTPQPAKP
jgi:uncharacterized protein HemX